MHVQYLILQSLNNDVNSISFNNTILYCAFRFRRRFLQKNYEMCVVKGDQKP